MCAWAGGTRVSFAIDDVQEVLPVAPVTRLFHTSEVVLGVLNLRGEILPLIDLARLLDAADGPSDEARFVVLRVRLDGEGAQRTTPFAVRVARLDALRDATSDAVEPLPPGVPEAAARVARGMLVTKGPAALVIDPARVVAVDAIAALRRSEPAQRPVL